MRLSPTVTAFAASLSGLSLVALPAWSASGADAPQDIAVTIGDKGCVPMELTAPPSKVSFKIKNESKRAVEWEILKNQSVIEERENILPGFVSTLTAKLDPGEYEMTCGLLNNPKGKLTVKAAITVEDRSKPRDFGPEIVAYKAYVTGEAEQLATGTRTLVDAVKAGKLEEAQKAYAPAHFHYERIEPVAEVFNDLDKSMDSRADDYENKEKDPNFAGFHRLEFGLFSEKSTAGLNEYADRLMKDALDLKGRVATLDITPKILAGGAAELIEEVAAKKISGEEDRYSKTDLWDFQANVDGAQKIVALLRQDITARDPALIAQIDTNFARVDSKLAKYKNGGDGFKSYDSLTPEDQKALKGPITALAEDLSKLRGTLGID